MQLAEIDLNALRGIPTNSLNLLCKLTVPKALRFAPYSVDDEEGSGLASALTYRQLFERYGSRSQREMHPDLTLTLIFLLHLCLCPTIAIIFDSPQQNYKPSIWVGVDSTSPQSFGGVLSRGRAEEFQRMD